MATTNKHTIILYRDRGCWLSVSDDPRVFLAFGTTTLPTAFTDKAKAEDVMKEIQRLNPECVVLFGTKK